MNNHNFLSVPPQISRGTGLLVVGIIFSSVGLTLHAASALVGYCFEEYEDGSGCKNTDGIYATVALYPTSFVTSLVGGALLLGSAHKLIRSISKLGVSIPRKFYIAGANLYWVSVVATLSLYTLPLTTEIEPGYFAIPAFALWLATYAVNFKGVLFARQYAGEMDDYAKQTGAVVIPFVNCKEGGAIAGIAGVF